MLSLVENKRESGLFHWAVSPAPAFEAQGPGGTLGWSYDGGRAQRVVQISQYQGGGWGTRLEDVMLKFHLHHRSTAFLHRLD